MDIARVGIAFPVQRLRERAGIMLRMIRRAKRYHSPTLPDDSRRQLQHERLMAQLRLDRLNIAVRQPL